MQSVNILIARTEKFQKTILTSCRVFADVMQPASSTKGNTFHNAWLLARSCRVCDVLLWHSRFDYVIREDFLTLFDFTNSNAQKTQKTQKTQKPKTTLRSAEFWSFIALLNQFWTRNLICKFIQARNLFLFWFLETPSVGGSLFNCVVFFCFAHYQRFLTFHWGCHLDGLLELEDIRRHFSLLFAVYQINFEIFLWKFDACWFLGGLSGTDAAPVMNVDLNTKRISILNCFSFCQVGFTHVCVSTTTLVHVHDVSTSLMGAWELWRDILRNWRKVAGIHFVERS